MRDRTLMLPGSTTAHEHRMYKATSQRLQRRTLKGR
jgi:hypothetical protein